MTEKCQTNFLMHSSVKVNNDGSCVTNKPNYQKGQTENLRTYFLRQKSLTKITVYIH